MKLDEMINELTALRKQLGNVDVIVNHDEDSSVESVSAIRLHEELPMFAVNIFTNQLG